MEEDKLIDNLNKINKNLGKISMTLDLYGNALATKDSLDHNGDSYKKEINIKSFPDENYFGFEGSSVLKTEITNFPETPKKDKEYLIFNTSTITNQVRLKLLLLSLLGLLYSIYDIEISTLFGTTIKDDSNNLPSVLFTLILVEFIFFLSVYYRDLKKHNVEKKHIKNVNFSNVKGMEKELKRIRGKNIFKFIKDYLVDRGVSQANIDKIMEKFKYSKNANFSDIINFSEVESKSIKHILDEYIKNPEGKEGLEKINELVSIESKNRQMLSDVEFKLSYTKEEKGEFDLESFNKNYIFIIFMGLYPIFLALLSLYFLYIYDKLNITILSNFYKGIGGWIGLLFLSTLICIGYLLINNVLKTDNK